MDITFIAGDVRPSLLAELQEHRLRPLYGPVDAAGRRPLIGAIAGDHVERFADMIAFADAHMPDDRAYRAEEQNGLWIVLRPNGSAIGGYPEGTARLLVQVLNMEASEA